MPRLLAACALALGCSGAAEEPVSRERPAPPEGLVDVAVTQVRAILRLPTSMEVQGQSRSQLRVVLGEGAVPRLLTLDQTPWEMTGGEWGPTESRTLENGSTATWAARIRKGQTDTRVAEICGTWTLGAQPIGFCCETAYGQSVDWCMSYLGTASPM